MLNKAKIGYIALLILLGIILAIDYHGPTEELRLFNFFGVYVGSVRLFGIGMEHEYFGLGILGVLVPFYRQGYAIKMLAGLGLIGAFLFFSDFASILELNFITNFAGMVTSIIVGALMAFLIIQIWR